MSLSNEYDPNEQVLILRQHVQEALAALSWCHSRETALDLADAYRQGRQSPTPSKITALVTKAYNHLEGYLIDELPE